MLSFISTLPSQKVVIDANVTTVQTNNALRPPILGTLPVYERDGAQVFNVGIPKFFSSTAGGWLPFAVGSGSLTPSLTGVENIGIGNPGAIGLFTGYDTITFPHDRYAQFSTISAGSGITITPTNGTLVFSASAGSINDLQLNGNTTQTASATGTYAISMGHYSTASGATAIAIGSSPITGLGAIASGAGSISIGAGSSTFNGAVAIGSNSIAIGSGTGAADGALALNSNCISIGITAVTISPNDIAIGSGASTNGVLNTGSSIAIGTNAISTGGNSICIGPGATASAANAVAFGSGATNNTANSFAFNTQPGPAFDYLRLQAPGFEVQTTSNTTPVGMFNAPYGTITMSAALAPNSFYEFTFNNTLITSSSIILLTPVGAVSGSGILSATTIPPGLIVEGVTTGSCTIAVSNPNGITIPTATKFAFSYFILYTARA
jgi:hypothetical protein